MRKRINRQLILMTVLASLVTMVLMILMFWHLLQRQVLTDLKSDAVLMQQAELYRQELLYEPEEDTEDFRITWIAADGTVLGDTNANQDGMENHARRPEIIEAIQHGEGYDIRNSETLDEDTFYYAVRLEDGTVLRVARDIRSVWSIVLSVLPVLLVALVLLLLLCLIAAKYLAKSIMEPLERAAEKMEYAEITSEYRELEPFLKTIRMQHENILRAAKVRQDFTANVSHELKTPLTAISGYAELMEAGMIEGESVKHYAQEIHHNSNRLLSLINDIIHLSEMDRTEYEVPMERVNLSELAQRCVEILQVAAEKRGISMRYVGEPALVYGNRELLEELLWNLCDNAIRYNKENGMVKVQVENNKEDVMLSVSDTGIGISAEHQERIFERFYRVDKSRSKETGGTGLGLAIVKHIVSQHNAELTLESVPEEGTKVTIRFLTR